MAYRGQGIDLATLFALGRAGTGLIAAPRIIQGEEQANTQDRMLLAELGVSPEQIDRMAPTPAITLPSGTLGKILSGVGTTGAILNSMFGGSIPAPRPDIGDIAAIGKLMADKGEKTRARAALEEAAGLFKTPLAQSLARAGKTEAAVRAEKVDELGLPKTPWAARLELHSGRLDPDVQAAVSGALAENDEQAARRALQLAQIRTSPMVVGPEAERARQLAGETARGRVDVETDPELAARRAEVAGQRAETMATHRRLGERRPQLEAVNRLLDQLEGALERRLQATGVVERIQQGVGMMAFKQSPKLVAGMMGLDPAEAQQLADDIEVIESPEAFAGQIIKAIGADSGQLANQDIGRITRRFATKFEAGVVAKAKMKVLRGLVADLGRLPPQNPNPAVSTPEGAAAADRAIRQLDAINTGGRTPGEASTGAAPRTAEEYMRLKGLR